MFSCWVDEVTTGVKAHLEGASERCRQSSGINKSRRQQVDIRGWVRKKRRKVQTLWTRARGRSQTFRLSDEGATTFARYIYFSRRVYKAVGDLFPRSDNTSRCTSLSLSLSLFFLFSICCFACFCFLVFLFRILSLFAFLRFVSLMHACISFQLLTDVILKKNDNPISSPLPLIRTIIDYYQRLGCSKKT